MTTTECIATEMVKPLHEVRDKRKLRTLVADMKKNGWNGRPLLVVERQDGYVAWTGSHRLAAANKAEIDSIPCYVIQEARLLPLGVDAEWGHVDDSDRLNIVRELGDETAIHIMWQEGRE